MTIQDTAAKPTDPKAPQNPEVSKPPKPPKSYKLNVQGVVIESVAPRITVEAAMIAAGFDVTQAWIMILRIKGEPKRLVELATIIDLTHDGVEKLRLTPKDISNGETLSRRRDFALLDADEDYLARTGLVWATVLEGGVRWLILRGYPLPDGYTASQADIALQIPLTYPGAQIDMFYCHPPLARTDGGAPAATEVRVSLEETVYQRWSRHRPDGAWSRERDNVATHMTLVDEALHREVGQ